MNKEEREAIREKLWSHHGCFEGVKCKTSLPLDWVDNVLDEFVEEGCLSKQRIKESMRKCYDQDLDINSFIHNLTKELSIVYTLEEVGLEWKLA